MRLDERWGEIILSKALGSILVIVFVWLIRHKLKDICLHSKRIGQSLLIGASITIIAFLVSYGMDAGMMIRMPIFTSLALLSMYIVKFLAEKFQMDEVQPWQTIYQNGEQKRVVNQT